jgi:NAD(P)-dependent dehydrogenase (short-subunit alcohol dehydrogenase family)
MIIDRFRLDGKIALVTGATRGIGLGISRALAEAGARVVMSSRQPRPDIIAALDADGHDIDYIEADMLAPGAPEALIAETLARHQRIDILVNNAGVAQHGETHSFDADTYRRLMTTNLDSLFFACKAVLSAMRAQGGGVILNIGSISGLVSNIPQPQAAYNASKAAVHMLTKSLASDYAADNIRVNAIAPGYIDTDMTRGGLEHPEWGPIWRQMTPMGRAGTVDEIAAGALYLCSPASSYVTGEIHVIDGGYTAR